ncbi:MAG: DUF6452 family protein [Prolixibacteraceae bacterium]|jgi:hypothetical protein|nr:DUF6452 family protein [Prolixibacteraceae bacterium]
MQLKQKNSFFILLAIAFLLIACDELPCDDKDGVQLNAGFYTYDGVNYADTSINSPTIHLINSDSTSYIDSYTSEIHLFSFPLSFIADSSTIVLEFQESVFDTVTIYYNTNIHLENHQCGFAYYFDIREIQSTNNLLDSVWISKKLVEYGDNENIKIYF